MIQAFPCHALRICMRKLLCTYVTSTDVPSVPLAAAQASRLAHTYMTWCLHCRILSAPCLLTMSAEQMAASISHEAFSLPRCEAPASPLPSACATPLSLRACGRQTQTHTQHVEVRLFQPTSSSMSNCLRSQSTFLAMQRLLCTD